MAVIEGRFYVLMVGCWSATSASVCRPMLDKTPGSTTAAGTTRTEPQVSYTRIGLDFITVTGISIAIVVIFLAVNVYQHKEHIQKGGYPRLVIRSH